MTAKTQIKTLAIKAIENIAELELKNIKADIIYSTNLGLQIVVFYKPVIDNLSFYVYPNDDIELGTEIINKLIETIKLDDYEEIIKLYMEVY